MELIPVKKSTWGVTDESWLDFSDEKRFGKVTGGVFTNTGRSTAVIDDTIQLIPGASMPIRIDYPYIDHSNYKISFTGAGINQLSIILYKVL